MIWVSKEDAFPLENASPKLQSNYIIYVVVVIVVVDYTNVRFCGTSLNLLGEITVSDVYHIRLLQKASFICFEAHMCTFVWLYATVLGSSINRYLLFLFLWSTRKKGRMEIVLLPARGLMTPAIWCLLNWSTFDPCIITYECMRVCAFVACRTVVFAIAWFRQSIIGLYGRSGERRAIWPCAHHRPGRSGTTAVRTRFHK